VQVLTYTNTRGRRILVWAWWQSTLTVVWFCWETDDRRTLWPFAQQVGVTEHWSWPHGLKITFYVILCAPIGVPSLELCVIHFVLELYNLMSFLVSSSARNRLIRMVMWTLWWYMNVAFFLIFSIRLEPCNIQQVGTECATTLYSLLLCRVSRPLFQFLVESFSFCPVQNTRGESI